MINLLMNLSEIDRDWCRPVLKDYLRPGVQVVVVPFAFHEGFIHDPAAWQENFSAGKKQYQEIVQPLLTYGVREEDVAFVNYFLDDPRTFGTMLRQADVIVFPGGWPDKMMRRLWEFGAISQIASFPGVILGYSAGAMIQIDCFHMTPEEEGQEFSYCEGLGMIDTFDVEVHYAATPIQQACIARTVEETGRGVFAMENEGGLLVEGTRLTTFGKVHYFGPNDRG